MKPLPIVFALLCLSFSIYYEVHWVTTAYQQDESGSYPELYGPVSFFRWPVHFVSLACLGYTIFAIIRWQRS